MALDKQINMFSCDTGHFYSNHEAYLHNMNCRYRSERNYISNRLKEYEEILRGFGYSDDDLQALSKGNIDEMSIIIPGTHSLLARYNRLSGLIRHKRKKAKESKQEILRLLSNKMRQNEITGGKDHVRVLDESKLNDDNVISVFESSLTRMLGIQQDELTTDLVVVQIYYFDVFKDMVYYGFMFRGEKYRYYTSSAGQIRKKKAVFIKESIWDKFEQTIMCGLTINKINAKGGNNVNKHLAYMALTNSATDEWKEFDIDRCIVIDDFETNVFGTFDLIDDIDYSITRKSDYVPITHTDGAGMVLPGYLGTNAMFRAPWIKGLLGVFDFISFICENEYSPVITDIYGDEHNVLDEDIRIIFTKSQFKMWKFYDNWDDYKKCFKEYHCSAGLCNVEEPRIKNATINYQMLQTLTAVTDEELLKIAKPSIDRLNNMCSSIDNLFGIFGITPYNAHMTPLQKSIKIYPNLLNDEYLKNTIRDIKNSLVKQYKAGKLEIDGKYTFILPDFYAACQYWFGHKENPDGLLKDGEVFCWLFKNRQRLDCLRSPHLFKEHAVRANVAYEEWENKEEFRRKWFTTNALYTSCHDLISKILQFDDH